VKDDSSASERIAIAATFVAEPIEQALAFWLSKLDMESRIEFAPYHQVLQELLDPSSLFSSNRRGVNVILARVEDWYRADSSAAELENNVREFISALAAFSFRSQVMLLVFICPSSAEPAKAALFKASEERIVSELGGIANVRVVCGAALNAAYSVDECFDPHADKIAHIPYTPLFFCALATSVARGVHALKNSGRYKAIVVDGDETLWSGICGEDGALGIRINAPRHSIQQFLAARHEAGMLICLCSRNNEDDVVAVFERRKNEMPLSREHFAAWRIDWRPKSDNIRSLSEELNIGLDSIVFIDDDPIACAEVRANCPEVLTLELPQPPETIPEFLDHLWLFDGVPGEGAGRTTQYQQARQREQLRLGSATFQEFLAGLRLKIGIVPLAPGDLPRVAELTHRTNQFNFTAIRRDQAQLSALCQSGCAECLVVRASDRFGDYGLVGAIICDEQTEDGFRVDTFLLSCRALGRGVEHRMLARLAEVAVQRSKRWIDIPFIRTQKNRPAFDFLEQVAAHCQAREIAPLLFRFAAARAAQLDFSAFVAQAAPAPQQAPPTRAVSPVLAVSAAKRAELYASIALELCDAQRIHAAIAAQMNARPRLDTEYVAPRTTDEEKIAQIFTELLGIDQIGVDDSFFDLGGHSLLATQMLSRLRAAFRVEVSPRLVFTSRFTVADLAAAIEEQSVEQVSSSEIAALLRELEALSDDEVSTLLSAK
jgi:FkbH-like protein